MGTGRELSDTDRQRLTGALGVVSELITGPELDALRQVIEQLERKLREELAELGGRLDGSLSDFKSEISRETDRLQLAVAAVEERLAAGIEQADRAVQGAAEAVELELASARGAIADVDRRSAEDRQRLDRIAGQVDRALADAPDKLESRFEAVEAGLRSHVDERVARLERAFQAIERKVSEQTQAAQRLSGLLTNLETVFSARQPTSQRSAADPDPTVDPKSVDRDAPQMSSTELDNALNNLFHGS
ncbi:MAG TPA: hypothetical protein VD788_18090 [Candidatus Polarisedimenticolaceae bacterium]|nr:hypothetical protein [Candidatus Polarisedimenticolaceae bacterium]